jgi:hypothetical protein
MPRSKLYLNPIFSKLGTQLFCVLMVNGVHPEAARAFQVQRAVIDEKTMLRRALGDFQRDAKDGFFRLAGTNVTGAEENQKVSAKVEGLNAVLVELQWLIVDGSDKVFSGACDFIKNGAGVRVFFRLREHKGGEFFTRKAALAIKQSAVEILVQGDLSGVESREGEIVAVLKFLPIEVENDRSFFPRTAVPAICQDDTADVPKERGDFSHGRSSLERSLQDSTVPFDEHERERIRNSWRSNPTLPERGIEDDLQLWQA